MTALSLRWWMPPLFAVQFLTRLPVPGLSGLDSQAVQHGLSRAMAWFPLVGGLVGAATALMLVLVDGIWPRSIAVLLALMVEARLTGAFHEDAVADFCDGFGGGTTPERIHMIMKDSRIGSYGTLGLVLAVGLRAALLIVLPAQMLVPALLASASFGRLMAVFAMAMVPPFTRSSGIAKDIAARIGARPCVVAVLFALPFMAPLAIGRPGAMLAALSVAALFLLWFRGFLMRHLGGMTGDCLGFAVYAGQLVMLLGAAASPP